MAYNNEGWCLWQMGKYSEAIEVFKKALEESPNFADSLYNLGIIYRNLGRYREARDNFKLILKIAPDKYPALDSIVKDLEYLILRRRTK